MEIHDLKKLKQINLFYIITQEIVRKRAMKVNSVGWGRRHEQYLIGIRQQYK